MKRLNFSTDIYSQARREGELKCGFSPIFIPNGTKIRSEMCVSTDI
jgi:hypothetical protein